MIIFLTNLRIGVLKKKTNIHNYTIEHIMPQNPDLSQEWKDAQDLGHVIFTISESILIHQERFGTIRKIKNPP